MARRIGLIFAIMAACASAPAAPPKKLVPPAELSARFLESCTAACERSRAMQAVGWEMIHAECARGCEEDWALPLQEKGTDLAKSDGQRVRLRGELLPVSDAGAGARDAMLNMAGGAVIIVRLPAPPNPHAPGPWGRAVVTGTLSVRGGRMVLEHVGGVVLE